MNNKTTLRILLVLSMIWAGLSVISYLMIGVLQPSLQNYYSTHPDLLPEQFYTMMQQLFEIPRAYFIGCAVLFGLELMGAVLMWNMRRSGFHCYALARLLLVLLPLLFLGRGAVALGDVMFALLFIVVYYMLLRQLGVFGSKEDDETPAGDMDNQSDSNAE